MVRDMKGESVPGAGVRVTDGCAADLPSLGGSVPLRGVVAMVFAGTDDKLYSLYGYLSQMFPQMLRYLLIPQSLDLLVVVDAPPASDEEEETTSVKALVASLGLRLEDVEEVIELPGYVEPGASLPEGVAPRGRQYRFSLPVTRESQPSWSDDEWSAYDAAGRLPLFLTIHIVVMPVPIPDAALDRDYVRWGTSASRPVELGRPMEPDDCIIGDVGYVQGTRMYTYHLWQLALVQQVDFVFKVDYDIWFHNHIPFNLMVDMAAQDAVFAHSGEFAGGECSCSYRMNLFVEGYSMLIDKRACSQAEDYWENCDRYYTNFVGMRRDFWSSPEVLGFALAANMFPEGFWHHRWTDQTFFHRAIGMVLAQDRQHVRDYSQYRCALEPPNPDERVCFLVPMVAGKAQHCVDRRSAFVHLKQAPAAGVHGSRDWFEEVVPRTGPRDVGVPRWSAGSPVPDNSNYTRFSARC
jgi:hypothetical protein